MYSQLSSLAIESLITVHSLGLTSDQDGQISCLNSYDVVSLCEGFLVVQLNEKTIYPSLTHDFFHHLIYVVYIQDSFS
jgi:hypothetical protein